MKSLLLAMGMAVLLFVYGYVFSTAGHDHSLHQGGGHAAASSASSHSNEHHEHS